MKERLPDGTAGVLASLRIRDRQLREPTQDKRRRPSGQHRVISFAH